MPEMVELTPNDSSALARLIRFDGLPLEKRREILGEIQAADARAVGEIFLEPERYDGASPKVQATVNRFREWMDVNRHLAKERAKRRRSVRARNTPPALASQP